jgi:spermidine synthase
LFHDKKGEVLLNKPIQGKGFTEWNGEVWLSDPEEAHGFLANWKVKEVLHQETSDFQEVAVIEMEGFGRALVLDGIVQTTTRDAYIYNEMITHVPLAAHPEPKQVCLIGGGDCGAAREAVKYPAVDRVDMVEIDPKVVEVSRKYLPEVAGEGEMDPRIQLYYEDGAAFIREKKRHYDVVIVDSSDPVGPAAALFEKPFYETVHQSLKEDGIMVCQSESPMFHPHMLRKVHHTLKELFPVVHTYLAAIPTYPGGVWSFTLASKQVDPLTEMEAVKARLQDGQNRYIDQGLLEGCFKLPVYVKELVR